MLRLILPLLLCLCCLSGCETLVGVKKDLHTVGKVLQGAANQVEASLDQK